MSLFLLIILKFFFLLSVTLDQIKMKINNLKNENRDLEKNIASWEEKVCVPFQIFFCDFILVTYPLVVHSIDLYHATQKWSLSKRSFTNVEYCLFLCHKRRGTDIGFFNMLFWTSDSFSYFL